MNTRYRSTAVGLLALLCATGCDSNVTGPLAVGTMDISITGAVRRGLRAGAGFGTGGTGLGGASSWIEIGRGDSIDGLNIKMFGRTSAPPGSYPLEIPGVGDTTAIKAVLRHRDDSYIAESGTLTITHSPGLWFASDDHVDGTFDFTAVYWCTGVCRTLPMVVTPDLPRIHVTGKFSAAPPLPVPTLSSLSEVPGRSEPPGLLETPTDPPRRAAQEL